VSTIEVIKQINQEGIVTSVSYKYKISSVVTDILLPSPEAMFDAIKSPIGNYQPFSELPND
jgi:hypothetical protein